MLPRLSVELKPKGKRHKKQEKRKFGLCVIMENMYIKNITSKNILAQIDASRSLAYSSTCNVENSIKNIRVTIVEPYPMNKPIMSQAHVGKFFKHAEKVKAMPQSGHCYKSLIQSNGCEKTYFRGLARTL